MLLLVFLLYSLRKVVFSLAKAGLLCVMERGHLARPCGQDARAPASR